MYMKSMRYVWNKICGGVSEGRRTSTPLQNKFYKKRNVYNKHKTIRRRGRCVANRWDERNPRRSRRRRRRHRQWVTVLRRSHERTYRYNKESHHLVVMYLVIVTAVVDKESLQEPVHSGDRSRTCLHHTPPHCTEPDLAMPFIEAIAPATPPLAISWRRAHDDCEHHTTAQQPSLLLSRSLLTDAAGSFAFHSQEFHSIRAPAVAESGRTSYYVPLLVL